MKAKIFLAVLLVLLAGCGQNKSSVSGELNENGNADVSDFSDEMVREQDGAGVVVNKDDSTWYVVSAEGVNLRFQPTTQSKIIIAVPDNYPIKILGRTDAQEKIGETSNFWYQASVDGKIGWVFGEYINSQPKEFAFVTEMKEITLFTVKELIEKRSYEGSYRVFSVLNGNFDIDRRNLSDITLRISYTANKEDMVVRCNFPREINKNFTGGDQFVDDYGVLLTAADGLIFTMYFTSRGIVLYYSHGNGEYQCNILMIENKNETGYVLMQ
ncbi:MAG: SH3 domain-containing protein [Treponema sp.]|nr:SH3 domain-containing protein [Treponema sp.]